jgi:hypothetical protein
VTLQRHRWLLGQHILLAFHVLHVGNLLLLSGCLLPCSLLVAATHHLLGSADHGGRCSCDHRFPCHGADQTGIVSTVHIDVDTSSSSQISSLLVLSQGKKQEIYAS